MRVPLGLSIRKVECPYQVILVPFPSAIEDSFVAVESREFRVFTQYGRSPRLDREQAGMRYVSSTRIAILGSALAVLSAGLPTVLGFYATLVAAAILLGAGFLAYMTAVERPSALAATDLVVCAVVSMLVLADASIRFPTVVDGTASSASSALAETALILSIAGAILPVLAPAYRYASRAASADVAAHLGEVAHRSARRWRRLFDTAL